jgi:Na+-translocating ferredoxin:NAD+ oxidoreductase RnfG subunit
MKVMENIYYFIFHPQPPMGSSRSELTLDWCAAEVPFRACPDSSGGFRGKKWFILIFCLLFALAGFGQNEIDYQNKRIINGLKKSGISGFSELEEINQNLKDQPEIQGKFFKVINNSEVSEVKYVFVGRVNSCRTGGCSISGNTPSNMESEYFDYCIFFDSSKTVKQVEVFNYQATHGYEITAKGWLKQFTGFSGKDSLEVNKNIDSISGATISVYAITSDVQQKTRLLKEIL